MLRIAIGIVKDATENLPESDQKTEVEATLTQAEKQLKLAEVQIANDLQYELCRQHFPPEIMLSANNKLWKCPKCGNQVDTEVRGINLLYSSRKGR